MAVTKDSELGCPFQRANSGCRHGGGREPPQGTNGLEVRSLAVQRRPGTPANTRTSARLRPPDPRTTKFVRWLGCLAGCQYPLLEPTGIPVCAVAWRPVASVRSLYRMFGGKSFSSETATDARQPVTSSTSYCVVATPLSVCASRTRCRFTSSRRWRKSAIS